MPSYAQDKLLPVITSRDGPLAPEWTSLSLSSRYINNSLRVINDPSKSDKDKVKARASLALAYAGLFSLNVELQSTKSTKGAISGTSLAVLLGAGFLASALAVALPIAALIAAPVGIFALGTGLGFLVNNRSLREVSGVTKGFLKHCRENLKLNGFSNAQIKKLEKLKSHSPVADAGEYVDVVASVTHDPQGPVLIPDLRAHLYKSLSDTFGITGSAASGQAPRPAPMTIPPMSNATVIHHLPPPGTQVSTVNYANFPVTVRTYGGPNVIFSQTRQLYPVSHMAPQWPYPPRQAPYVSPPAPRHPQVQVYPQAQQQARQQPQVQVQQPQFHPQPQVQVQQPQVQVQHPQQPQVLQQPQVHPVQHSALQNMSPHGSFVPPAPATIYASNTGFTTSNGPGFASALQNPVAPVSGFGHYR